MVQWLRTWLAKYGPVLNQLKIRFYTVTLCWNPMTQLRSAACRHFT